MKLLCALLAMSGCATAPAPTPKAPDEESCETQAPTSVGAADSLSDPRHVAAESLLALSSFGIPCEQQLVRLGDRTESEFGTLWTAWCQNEEWLCVHELRGERSGLVLPRQGSTCATGARARTLSAIGLHCTRL